MENKSYEQLVEDYTRQIVKQKNELLEAFSKAYAAQLAHLGTDFSLDDICFIEQEPHFRDGCLTRRYWFEFKPKFNPDKE